jgi:hypothetical protein
MGLKTWSLILSEKHGLRTFENTVLRKISEPERKKTVGGWRKLLN